MAEIAHRGSKNTNPKIRVNRKSTRIDMTPMVDLAFLLLTFFILTSSLSKHQMISLEMPEKVEDTTLRQRVEEKDVLNIVLAEDNKLYWWRGPEREAKATNYSREGIRKILLDHKSNLSLMVLIKPMDNSKYQNMVDMLDEIAITAVPRYAIVDYTEDDKNIMSGNVAGYLPR